MNPRGRRFLFLIRHPPLAGARMRETLDLILTVAAFDQWVTVLFLDDGVYQLAAPRAESVEADPLWLSMLKALELYDLQGILVEEDSLKARGLEVADLSLGAELIPAHRVRALISEHDRLVVC